MDILTLQVVKDRGVLSDLPKRCNFGDLADKDEAVDTDLGSEAADNLVGTEEDDNEEEEEDDTEETDAFPSTDDLVASKLARAAPFGHATNSSDANDLREFLKAEAIRRELDGGDDDSLDGGDDDSLNGGDDGGLNGEGDVRFSGGDDDSSSEDEFNFLPPRLTPAKRTVTPARKIVRVEPRLPKGLNLDSESEEEFAACELGQNGGYCGYRTRRTPSPEVLASISSPPLSSSPGPSSSLSLPPSPLSSYTPFNSNSGSRAQEHLGSPTPRRQPVASTSQKTLEDIIDEVDSEFPPPRPRAPPFFTRRQSSPFFIDILTLSGDETEDERHQPKSPAKVVTDPKPLPSEPRKAKKPGPAPVPKRPVPYVLIETKLPTPTAPTVVGSKPTPASTDSGSGTSTKRITQFKSSPRRGTASKQQSSRTSVTTPKRTSSTRSTESGASTATTKLKPKVPKKPPEVVSDIDDDESNLLPPSPSPAPPRRPWTRRALKRKRIVSSGSSSSDVPKAGKGERSSPPGSGTSQVREMTTPQ